MNEDREHVLRWLRRELNARALDKEGAQFFTDLIAYLEVLTSQDEIELAHLELDKLTIARTSVALGVGSTRLAVWFRIGLLVERYRSSVEGLVKWIGEQDDYSQAELDALKEQMLPETEDAENGTDES